MTEIQQGLYNPEISNIAKETGGNLADIKTNTDYISASLDQYKVSNVDDDASPNYYGFEDKDGNWYIMKETISSGANTYLYCKGTSDYSTAWTNRLSQSYTSFSLTF